MYKSRIETFQAFHATVYRVVIALFAAESRAVRKRRRMGKISSLKRHHNRIAQSLLNFV